MDNNNQVPEPIEKPEDAALEQEALSDVKEDAIRASLIEELGLADVPENAEYIDKLVARETKQRQKFSTVVRQKINWREKAKKPAPAPAFVAPTAPKPNAEVEDVPKLVQSGIDAALDAEKLADLELSDESKSELKAYAQSKGITVRAALKSDYFTFLKKGEDDKKREEDASISRANSKPATTTSYSLEAPPQVDMSTPEGRETYEKWFAWRSKQKG